MKRWLKAVLVVLAICGILILAAGLALRSVVSGSGKDRLIAALGEKMGVPVSVGSVNLDIRKLLRFRPAVALDDVAIGNPPGFHAKDLLQAKRISAQVSLLPLFHKSVEVQSIVVDQPRIVVETNAHGITNVEEFVKKLASGPSTGTSTSLAIEELSVTSGTLVYAGEESLSLDDVGLSVSGFSKDRPCQLQVAAKLFKGRVSGFKVDGQAGPFTADSLPFDGRLELTLAPAEIPAQIRREQFGVMLSSPGDRARALLEATIKGDVYRTLGGPAKLTLSSILIGGHKDHLLPLSGQAPASMKATNLMSSAQFQLDIPNANLQLGSGQWTGSGEFRMHGKSMSGGTRGAIRNIDVNQFLSSFTSGNDKVYGLLSMPSSALQFAGNNAAEILSSLRGSAKLSVTQGRLAALDFATTLERVIGSQQSAAGAKGATPFSTLSADLTIGQSRIHVENLLLDAPTGLRITGNGVIGFDQSINFSLLAHLGGSLARLASLGPLHLPSGVTPDVPLTVTGTVESPQVHPQIGKMAKDAIHETVRGILGGFLNKKLP